MTCVTRPMFVRAGLRWLEAIVDMTISIDSDVRFVIHDCMIGLHGDLSSCLQICNHES